MTLDSNGYFTDTIAVTEDKLASVYEYKVIGKARPGTTIDQDKIYNLTSEAWFEREVRNAGKTEWRPSHANQNGKNMKTSPQETSKAYSSHSATNSQSWT